MTAAFYGFVGTGPSVTTQPSGQTADAGQPATFTAAATGNPTPAVQWQVSTDGGVTFSNVLGATSPTYTVTAEPSESGDQYQAVFTNSVGTVDTDAASLTVDTEPAVTTQPASKAVNEGQPVTFTAAANGTPAPTVQWQVSTDGGNTFNDVLGAMSTTYTFTTAAGDNGNQYRAAFTNVVGTVDSNPATLTLNTLPVITAQPANTSVRERAVAHFAAAATSYPTPTVRWQVSTNGGTTFSTIKGATATSYSFTASAGQNHDQYRAVFTNIGWVDHHRGRHPQGHRGGAGDHHHHLAPFGLGVPDDQVRLLGNAQGIRWRPPLQVVPQVGKAPGRVDPELNRGDIG